MIEAIFIFSAFTQSIVLGIGLLAYFIVNRDRIKRLEKEKIGLKKDHQDCEERLKERRQIEIKLIESRGTPKKIILYKNGVIENHGGFYLVVINKRVLKTLFFDLESAREAFNLI